MFTTFKNRNLMAVTLLATTALASTLTVATASADAAADEDVTEVTVTGRRPIAESEASALKAQRASDSLVSIIAADDVGDLPDQNIAFAVGRLPGVAIERDQGQARYVNLRGAPNYWTTLSFDGLSVVSPEGRASRFDNIPSAIASQISVQKALVPSMPGDAVAGNVDIRTRRAFDYNGQKITGKLAAGRVELGEGNEYDSSLVYSNIFLDGKLGVVVQGSYYKREMATENWETDPYLTVNAADIRKRFAQETKNKHYRLIRENYSASTRLDYKFNDNHQVFFSTINTVFHDDELRDQFIFQLNQGTNAAGQSYTSTNFVTGNDPKFGTVYGARISARVTYRDNDDRMSTNTFGGEHKFGKLDASWRLNYTWADNTGDNPLEIRFQSPSTFTARPTVVYDFRDGDSNIATLYRTTGTTSARTQGAQVQNVEDFAMPMSQATRQNASETTEAYTAKVDFDYETELFGRETKIEFGGLYTMREKKNEVFNGTGALSTTATYSSIAQNGDYLGEQRLGYTFRYTDRQKAYDLLNSSAGANNLVYSIPDYWNVGEDIAAGYLMATTQFDWGNVVYGARVEQIKNTGKAYVDFDTSSALNYRLVETESDETLFYPSIHLNWNVSDDLKARFGVTTSASRADYDDMRPNFTIDDTLDEITGGNPDAKPEKQVGFDAYLEWYQPNTFISAGLFYKDITDVLLRRKVTFGRTDLNTPGFDRSTYGYNTVDNGGDGYLQGAEIYYSGNISPWVQDAGLPTWMEGFGAKASATFTQSEVKLLAVGTSPARNINVQGSSDAIYNVQATYEKYGLTVRLAYQYRTPWGQSVGDYTTVGGALVPSGNGDIFWDADEEVDFSARYQVNKNFEVFFDGSNLTNQGAKRYADSVGNPIEFEKFGRRFVGGVRFNF
ncbi:TonB-dependent receptor [Asticcacaulis machinosus]|uniref:TonB-dependent receptor n=1 Tax=Asticcacaulis machinosus TaxID=2984211 RepID=A0ABT5HGC9_9CAUL|nr:TonB-dependent receptor [Asticcacaulis machinosus]MDC7675243.1 TonB-dependent receptor [Asticcacaulis machinosus]